MRRNDRSHDFFEAKFNSRCDEWSILFQTPHYEPEDSKVNTYKKTTYELEADSFWYSVKKWELRGEEDRKKKPIAPTKTVNNPSYGSG
jgi:hypothetical protein